MSTLDSRLAHLAHIYGIATEFWDWKGVYREASQETVIACLHAFDVDTTSEGWLDQAFIDIDERVWLKALEECIVVQQGHDKVINVHVPAGRPAHVWVRLEHGQTFALEQVENWDADRLIRDSWIGRASFRLPSWVDPGYHTIFLESDQASWESLFIVTPTKVDTHEVGNSSVWGFMVQLYSVCSQSSWGLGDFVDLADLATWAKTCHNADFILINPTHAAEVADPIEPSPYLPATRRFINPIYIRPESIQEYATSLQKVRTAVQNHRGVAYTTSQESTEVLRGLVWNQKKDALKIIFDVERRPSRQIEFDAFVDAHGETLRKYATWCVLTEHYGNLWCEWPQNLQHPDSAEVEQFAKDHDKDVTFYMWLQWIADLQAKDAQHAAKNVGMKVGIMCDLAVGVHHEGQETWADPQIFATGVRVGAPPDAYSQAGQDWSQPPWRPDRLKESAYAPLRAMISTMLSYSGALRIDHVIGQFRLWWIPEGMSPREGAYVRYDHEAMIGILALEAHRAGAVMIGEDLGTVEPWVREYLDARGLYGTSILWFENSDQGHPLNPEQWRQMCLGSVTTHDLPPTLGYLEHFHVALRYQLGLLTESLDDEIAADAMEQAGVISMLTARGLIDVGESDHHKIMAGLYRFLFQTSTKLKGVALTDVVGEKRAQNQPGTIDEYPNWRIPLGDEKGRRLTLEELYALPGVHEITDIMNGRL